MKKVIHRADTRGLADFGWLHSRHTFSFGRYYNPERVQFGALRVLNDDIVEPGMGFGTHPHDNMEIVSIPLAGTLAHKDSTGNEETIKTGEVQIMSAGTGLTHSEYNYSKTEQVNFLQIWVIPKERNIKPRYAQQHFDLAQNDFTTVVSPDDKSALWINQDAWFTIGSLDAGLSLDYKLHRVESGVYIFVIDGGLSVGGEKLEKRDAIGLSEISNVSVEADSDTKVLLIEIPM